MRSITPTVAHLRRTPALVTNALICLAAFFLCTAVNGQSANGSLSQIIRETSQRADKNIRGSARVNPSTLALEFSLSLMNYPGRSGNDVPVSFDYSSKVWRMNSSSTWWYPVNTSTRHVTDLSARFAEKSAAGWTSGIRAPLIEAKTELYDQYGSPFGENVGDQARLDAIWEEAVSAGNDGLMSSNGFECVNYIYVYCPDCRLPDGTTGIHIFLCTAWEMGGGIPEPTGGGGPVPDVPIVLNYVARIYVTMPGGTRSEFRRDDSVHECGTPGAGCVPDLNGTFLSVDGSGMRLEKTAGGSVLFMPNGSRYEFPGTANAAEGTYADRFVDVNGNTITYSRSSEGASTFGKVVDTLGREIVDPLPYNNIAQTQSHGVKDVALPGFGGNEHTYRMKWSHLRPPGCEDSADPECVGNDGSSGGALQDPSAKLFFDSRYLCRGSQTTDLLAEPGNQSSPANEVLFPASQAGLRPCSAFRLTTASDGQSVAVPVRFNPVVLEEVLLPNGRGYSFRYNRFGEISKIVYPSGVYEEYDHGYVKPFNGTGEAAYDQANRGVRERRIYNSDGELVQRWKYQAEFSFAPGNNSTYKVTARSSRADDPLADGSRTETLLDHAIRNDEFGFRDPLAGTLKEIRTYDDNGALRGRRLFSWKVKGPLPGGQPHAKRDLREAGTVSLTFEPGSSISLAAVTFTEFDENGASDPKFFSHLNASRSESRNYAAIGDALARTGSFSAIAGAAASSASRSAVTKRTFIYDPDYSELGIVGMRAKDIVVDPSDGVTVLNETEYLYDETDYPLTDPGTPAAWLDPGTALRGNVTTVKRSDPGTQARTAEHFQFDKFGNSRRSWDASGDPLRFNEIEYSPIYQFAYPTLLRAPAPDPAGEGGSAEVSEIAKEYDFNTGLLRSVTDRQFLGTDSDDRTTLNEYDDPLLRPTMVTLPSGVRYETTYNDTPGQISETTRSIAGGVSGPLSVKRMDGFGRTVRTEERSDEGTSVVETKYDNLGRVTAVSIPFFDGSGPPSWIRTEYDAAGRIDARFVPSLDGIGESAAREFGYGISAVPGQIGTYAVSTDGSGRSLRTLLDAAGNIIRIDEPTGRSGVPDSDLGPIEQPYQPTYYKYGKRGGLIEVRQGAQRRFFLYDGFGRLIRQRIPEQELNPELSLADPETGNSSWTTSFDYDALGNLVRTIDANGTEISTAHDLIGRVVSRKYSDGTPETVYKYDLAPFGKGRLIEVANSVSISRTTEFDIGGNPLISEQVTDGKSYVTRFEYDPSGRLVRTVYPSGNAVSETYGGDGRLRRVAGGAEEFGSTYANSFSYAANGKTLGLRLGNGRWESAGFDNASRLKSLGLGPSVASAALWRIQYEYGESVGQANPDPALNNGTVARVTMSAEGWPDAFVQTFAYDPLGRLSAASESAGQGPNWRQAFGYDMFGNRVSRTQTIGSREDSFAPSIDAATNRYSQGQGFSYDRNGNLVGDPSGRSIVFDGTNRQIEIRGPNGYLEGTYFYDGEGRRVKKVTPLETTVFVYAGGRLIAEYSDVGQETRDTLYLTFDHLDTPRVVTNGSGTVISRRDYMPFGEELFAGIGGRSDESGYSVYGDGLRHGFTGYAKDRESGLNHAEARMYDPEHGRFTSVDPLLSSADSGNPQSLNRYAYTLNNPVNLVDPSGLISVDDWYVSDGGEIELFKTEDSFDRFYVFDENRKVFVLVAQLERNKHGLVKFPSSGYGFTSYNPGERGGYDPVTGETAGSGDHYLKPITAAAMFGFTNQLKNEQGITLALGDMSSSNGSDPWDSKYRRADWNGHHATHGHFGVGTGTNIDFRYVDAAGNSQRGNWAENPGLFDAGKNQAVFDLAKKWGFTKSLRGYNVPIHGTRAAKGHNDHGHLGFDLSRKKAKVLFRDRKRYFLNLSDSTIGCLVEMCR